MSATAPLLEGAGLTANTRSECPSCGAVAMTAFYAVEKAPVHSVLLMPTREVAVAFPRRDIELGVCAACGFIANTIFDASVHSYSADYEETQGYSATFRAFHRDLALRLIEKFDLRGKNIIEIGCGKGEFLSLLTELGGNCGTGFDPAFVAERNPSQRREDVRFVTDFYSAKYSAVKADFICCKMTLEHIGNTREFVETVRHSIGERRDCVVFFMIPDMDRVVRDTAFWDVYYEHCSYFTAGSLRRLFERSGFAVLETGAEYDGQYLTIAARPSAEKQTVVTRAPRAEIEQLLRETENFAAHCQEVIARWRAECEQYARAGQKVVIWGSGSKGVALLTALGEAGSGIEYVVDINPHRQGKFMAGTGQEIVSPEFLARYRPDAAIVMNPIYQLEIQAELDRLHLGTSLLFV